MVWKRLIDQEGIREFFREPIALTSDHVGLRSRQVSVQNDIE